MYSEKEIIDIRNLKNGMITSDDIICNGTVLIKKGIKLSSQMIEKLRTIYSVDKIEIYIERKVTNESLAIEEANATLKSVSKSVESIFSNSQSLETSSTNEINKYAKKLLSHIKINNSMIKSIILSGSGEDCIYMHSVNVAVLSYLIGKWSGMPENKLHALVYASLLHDFGKIKISKTILNKTSKLTKTEYDVIKNHPVLAYNEIKDIPFVSQSVIYGILMHHERCDGSGYPLKITGDKIHEFAKIIAIADTFDAINSNRIYKKRRTPLQSLKIIKEESLTKLDYSLCTIFLKGLESYYIGQEALLSNNTTCKIIQLNPADIELPLVFTNNEFIDLSKSKDLSIVKLL
ncbi:HD-GYP domain-containing protein [Clostridium sp. AL.422]|uniref:HD-GYP domain-containing protein n=1 Tax=Clostridium TaxID=1485 RepID=UPI00293DD01E|nr:MULTISPECIES: HD-GYP domain-containing protein [unclassified Clostridium]MDV4152178.1 HD-GYP domain-containing protein [Clostridium sp. AL.422]